MTPERLLAWRLRNQYLARSATDDPVAVVAQLGAVQAQDYAQSLWGVGLRCRAAGVETVEAAIERGSILRTWPMRGTIHLVPAEDAAWMVRLLAGRGIAQAAGLHRKIGLTDEVLARAGQVVAEGLAGGRRPTRPELYALLTAAGIDCSASPNGGRGNHILGYLAMIGLVCIGPNRGRQPTVALLDEWAPTGREPDDPLAELAVRYLAGHGPAGARDLAWWAGLALGRAREAIDRAGPRLRMAEPGTGKAGRRQAGEPLWVLADEPAGPPGHAGSGPGAGTAGGPGPGVPVTGGAGDGAGDALLLPAYDEYTVGYQDRAALSAGMPLPAADVLSPVLVWRGRVVGLWRRVIDGGRVRIELGGFEPLAGPQREGFERAAEQYAGFLGLQPAITHVRSELLRRTGPSRQDP